MSSCYISLVLHIVRLYVKALAAAPFGRNVVITPLNVVINAVITIGVK